MARASVRPTVTDLQTAAALVANVVGINPIPNSDQTGYDYNATMKDAISRVGLNPAQLARAIRALGRVCEPQGLVQDPAHGGLLYQDAFDLAVDLLERAAGLKAEELIDIEYTARGRAPVKWKDKVPSVTADFLVAQIRGHARG